MAKDRESATTSGEITLPYAMLEQINAGIASLGTKVDDFREAIHRDKVDLTKALGDGNARMGMIEGRIQAVEARLSQVELTEPARVRHTLDNLSDQIKSADLPNLTASLKQVHVTLHSMQARDATISDSRTQIAAIQTKLHEQDAQKTRTPHWALLALGTAAITIIVGMILNAWVVIPSATRAAYAAQQADHQATAAPKP